MRSYYSIVDGALSVILSISKCLIVLSDFLFEYPLWSRNLSMRVLSLFMYSAYEKLECFIFAIPYVNSSSYQMIVY
ncbi:hypothetical protein PIROE2DRAFT_6021 [Piromyces sp. E2]|nr:hypothetical protein PIROE2DRAFT_6021 [Piromyces sp. E2]|eukprot:OUM66706.1 hypothetical protein PIROE2DRAFT_6021 [Piromyces sp. E2]